MRGNHHGFTWLERLQSFLKPCELLLVDVHLHCNVACCIMIMRKIYMCNSSLVCMLKLCPHGA